MTQALISLENVTIRRGDQALITGLTLAVAPGSLHALTGPNGSGKTSLLRALAGFLKPETGRVTRNGESFFLASEPPLIRYLSGWAHLKYWEALFKAPVEETHCRALDLRPGLMARPVQTLSAGQRKRLSFWPLLAAKPDIWLLDEPEGALDTYHTSMLQRAVKTHCGNGGAVVVATHRPELYETAILRNLGHKQEEAA